MADKFILNEDFDIPGADEAADVLGYDPDAEPTLEDQGWEYVASKDIYDEDGFRDSYMWYRKDGNNRFFFSMDADCGDPEYFDWETEGDEAAQEWFDSYGEDEGEEPSVDLDESFSVGDYVRVKRNKNLPDYKGKIEKIDDITNTYVIRLENEDAEVTVPKTSVLISKIDLDEAVEDNLTAKAEIDTPRGTFYAYKGTWKDFENEDDRDDWGFWFDHYTDDNKHFKIMHNHIDNSAIAVLKEGLNESKGGFVEKYRGYSIHDAGDRYVITDEKGLNVGETRFGIPVCRGMIDDMIDGKEADRITEAKRTKFPRGFNLGSSNNQNVKVRNPYNYTIQELSINNKAKTFERGNFSMGRADIELKNRQEYEDIVDLLKDQGYTEVKSDYHSLRNKTRKGIREDTFSGSSNSNGGYVKYNNEIHTNEKSIPSHVVECDRKEVKHFFDIVKDVIKNYTNIIDPDKAVYKYNDGKGIVTIPSAINGDIRNRHGDRISGFDKVTLTFYKKAAYSSYSLKRRSELDKSIMPDTYYYAYDIEIGGDIKLYKSRVSDKLSWKIQGGYGDIEDLKEQLDVAFSKLEELIMDNTARDRYYKNSGYSDARYNMSMRNLKSGNFSTNDAYNLLQKTSQVPYWTNSYMPSDIESAIKEHGYTICTNSRLSDDKEYMLRNFYSIIDKNELDRILGILEKNGVKKEDLDNSVSEDGLFFATRDIVDEYFNQSNVDFVKLLKNVGRFRHYNNESIEESLTEDKQVDIVSKEEAKKIFDKGGNVYISNGGKHYWGYDKSSGETLDDIIKNYYDNQKNLSFMVDHRPLTKDHLLDRIKERRKTVEEDKVDKQGSDNLKFIGNAKVVDISDLPRIGDSLNGGTVVSVNRKPNQEGYRIYEVGVAEDPDHEFTTSDDSDGGLDGVNTAHWTFAVKPSLKEDTNEEENHAFKFNIGDDAFILLYSFDSGKKGAYNKVKITNRWVDKEDNTNQYSYNSAYGSVDSCPEEFLLNHKEISDEIEKGSIYLHPKHGLVKDTPMKEDTIKTKSGKWTNKGKEGTHGKFNTKKEADAQRKAMFSQGFTEDLDTNSVVGKDYSEIKKKLYRNGYREDKKNFFVEDGKAVYTWWNGKKDFINVFVEDGIIVQVSGKLNLKESLDNADKYYKIVRQRLDGGWDILKDAYNGDPMLFETKDKAQKYIDSEVKTNKERYKVVKDVTVSKNKEYDTYTLYDESLKESLDNAEKATKEDILEYAKLHGDRSAADLLLLGGYEFFDGTADEYDALLKELEGKADSEKVDESLTEDADTQIENSVSSRLIEAINDEWKTIDLYNSIISELSATDGDDYKKMIPVIEDIVNEENVHVGQLQKALELISPDTADIAKGEKEAEGQIGGEDPSDDKKALVDESCNKTVKESLDDDDIEGTEWYSTDIKEIPYGKNNKRIKNRKLVDIDKEPVRNPVNEGLEDSNENATLIRNALASGSLDRDAFIDYVLANTPDEMLSGAVNFIGTQDFDTEDDLDFLGDSVDVTDSFADDLFIDEDTLEDGSVITLKDYSKGDASTLQNDSKPVCDDCDDLPDGVDITLVDVDDDKPLEEEKPLQEMGPLAATLLTAVAPVVADKVMDKVLPEEKEEENKVDCEVHGNAEDDDVDIKGI